MNIEELDLEVKAFNRLKKKQVSILWTSCLLRCTVLAA